MSNPVVLVYAGPNGSGKSTATKAIPHIGEYVNADELKKEQSLTDLEAAQKAETLRNIFLERRANFTFETVLSTERNLHLLKKAKEYGYEIQCIYVLTCNADINVARVKVRTCEGGHDVPEDKIRSRYDKALELLPQVIDVCDKMLIYDNSSSKMFLIFEKNGSRMEYFPSEIWPKEKLEKLIQR